MQPEATMFLSLLVLLVSFNGLETSTLVSQRARSQNASSRPPATGSELGSLVTVQTTSGLLHGAKQNLNIGNNSVYKFLSVPYAEAPVGPLRFQRPVEINDRSETILDASKFGKTCPQFRHLTRFISPLLNIDNEHQTSEDCLYLNVHVPQSVGTVVGTENNKLEPNKQLPVIVWIPGEGFDFADARQFDGSYLAHKVQAIVVTVQYRVGVLGFLHAPEQNIHGNMGIHDQLMALRWVRKNIGAFGGDSERVTLMGRFSGSMSISAMITAPKQELIKSDGQILFNRVAMLSGVAVSDWIIDSHQAERVKQLDEEAVAKSLCSTDQVKDSTCLQNMPVDQLLKISGYGWRLVVDNELIGQISPIDAIQTNQFASELESVLIGETGMEGTLCLYRHMLDTSNNYAQLIDEDRLSTNDLYDMIRDDSRTYFKYNLTKSNPIHTALESMIEDLGRGNAGDQILESSKLREKYLNACSAYMVKSHSHRLRQNIMALNHLAANRMNASKKPVEVYHYELKYKPTFSLAPEYIKTAAHGDDVPLIFGLIYRQPKREVNEADLLMTRKMMAYIGNFVHGNNPLLNQHSTIESKPETGLSRISEYEATSMEENEASYPEISVAPAPVYTRRSWLSEGQTHSIDFNESDLAEIKSRRRQAAQATPNSSQDTNSNVEPAARIQLRGDKTSVRVIVVEVPSASQVMDKRTQTLVDFLELSKAQQVEEPIFGQTENQVTRSQNLMRQQHQLEDNYMYQGGRKAQVGSIQPQAQQTTMTLVNEPSFMTMLAFSSCIVIFTLMSLCLGLCLFIFRNSLTNSNNNGNNDKGCPQFTNSSSSCNICDESQGNSIDAVLASHRKDGRGFSNVFAKLRNHGNSLVVPTAGQPQCTSASTTRQHQTNNTPVDVLVLGNHQQQAESGTNLQGH